VIVVVALAGVAVVIAVVVLAAGMGGELSETHPDHPPLPLPGNRPVAGTDAALLRLPVGLWGYHVRVTDEALRRLAYALTERDTRIAILEQQTADLRQRLEPGDPAEPKSPWASPAEALELESQASRNAAADRPAPAPQEAEADAEQRAKDIAEDNSSEARRQ
jgi:hypothetical protein